MINKSSLSVELSGGKKTNAHRSLSWSL